MGVVKILWQHGPLFPVLASNNRYCHLAKDIFDANSILLSHAISASLFADVAYSDEEIQKQNQTRVSITTWFVHWTALPSQNMKLKFDCFLWLSIPPDIKA